jgi:hypothetical protein
MNGKARNEKLRRKAFKQLCKEQGLPEPIAEYMFANEVMDRKWRADYYFERNGVQVILEVEGGVWTKGRHTRPKGFLRDMEKYNAMSRLGIFLLRTTPKDLLTVKTTQMIEQTLSQCLSRTQM